MALILTDAFWSGLAALGFAVLFNAPRRTLLGCVACGAVGHAVRSMMLEHFGLGIIPATLVGAVVVGFGAVLFAARWGAPAPIFSVCGVIPMVPGVFAYQTMLGILALATETPTSGDTLLVETTINAIKTTLVLGSLAIGIITPSLLFRRQIPVV